jgi:SAM-dependent methyltransferase
MAMFSINWEPKHGKDVFVRGIRRSGRVLDVGCGNNSPYWFKQTRPDLYYVGIDVGNYYQEADPNLYADEYVICAPQNFAANIGSYSNSMSAVVSNHNLEHCNQPSAVLEAMVGALKPGGMLYLSFPCEESVRFPKRGGSLNFFDDDSHQQVPDWRKILQTLTDLDCDLTFVAKRYRPFPQWLIGLALEPLSYFRKHVAAHGATWALYGFESIIWARKRHNEEVNIKDWGPKQTGVGVGINVQPNGSSAIWILLENLELFGNVHVEFSGEQGGSAANVDGNLVTAEIPQAIINRPGEHTVEIIDGSTKRIRVGRFMVSIGLG